MKNIFAVAAAWAMPVSAWAADVPAEPYSCWGPQMMWGGAWSGMFFGPLFMVLIVAVIIGAAGLISRSFGGPWRGAAPQHYPPSGRSPIDILKERFARGEIDKEEFEDRRRALGE